MDVFVIPIGRDRYELYCETSTAPPEPGAPPASLVGRLRHKVSTLLHSAEERRQRGAAAPTADSFVGRLQERTLAWAAERIAEQRLLWNLRSETSVALLHPQDLPFDSAHTLVRRTLQRDLERHRRWMVLDGIAFVFTFVALGPLFLLIPGVANLPALYFGFRTVGHWLSMRGAKQGLKRVTWSGQACAPLDDLRDAAALPAEAREARLRDVAARLRLQHLATFFERVAAPHAAG